VCHRSTLNALGSAALCAALACHGRLNAESAALPVTATAGGADALPSAPWNWHLQTTEIGQGDPGFAARYSGPHSLKNSGEIQETVSLDLYGGLRLWKGAEAHADAMLWQGYGLSQTFGIESFPNGEAYRAGSDVPNGMFARLFLRQTLGLGGPQEEVADDPLALSGMQDVSRLTLTLGRMSPLDVFDHNRYAGDPRTQFMNWGLMGNLTWDYGQDTLGYGTGLTAELNQERWTLRYGFFRMPPYDNVGNAGSGNGGEDQYLVYPARGSNGPLLKSWNQTAELEGRWSLHGRPGALRALGWVNEADMDAYAAAAGILESGGASADISAAQAYQYAYGICLNWEQELAGGLGAFSRVGWNDGKTQALEFSDANWVASLGLSAEGERWGRPKDNAGLGAVVSGISPQNQRFLEAGGLGIMDGDGALSYGPETAMEAVYDFGLWDQCHAAVDVQWVANPAYNLDRGPVAIFGARLHLAY
jgi:high affinity Mn2+ porin